MLVFVARLFHYRPSIGVCGKVVLRLYQASGCFSQGETVLLQQVLCQDYLEWQLEKVVARYKQSLKQVSRYYCEMRVEKIYYKNKTYQFKVFVFTKYTTVYTLRYHNTILSHYLTGRHKTEVVFHLKKIKLKFLQREIVITKAYFYIHALSKFRMQSDNRDGGPFNISVKILQQWMIIGGN